MSSKDIAVSVRGLAKSYTISHNAQQFTTIREALLHKIQKPLERNDKETFWALKDLNFDIYKGDVVGVMGRNGAGKSTLLKVLSQITEPTKGEIKLYGRIGSLLEVGTGFHPELTGRENIFLNGSILGMSRKEILTQFDGIVEFSGVSRFLDTPVKRYSSGMYVRLAFAVAAHLDPEILIVDEVLSVGDIEFQKKCIGKMRDIANSGRTVLFVSHNIAAMRLLCSKGIHLAQGSLRFAGTCEDCIQSYSESGQDSGRILDSVVVTTPGLVVDEIIINNSKNSVISLPSDRQSLDIAISGSVKGLLRLSIEARIFDYNYQPLAFFSPGHNEGEVTELKAGKFSIRSSISLPDMTKGEYFISLFLTDPGISSHAEVVNAIQLEVEGTATNTGRVFNYSDGDGWLVLNGSQEVNNF